MKHIKKQFSWVRSPALSSIWIKVRAETKESAMKKIADKLCETDPKKNWHDLSGWEYSAVEPTGTVSTKVVH